MITFPRVRPPAAWLRLSLRTRLTVLYGGLFFLAGVLIIAAAYIITERSLDRDDIPAFAQPPQNVRISSQFLGYDENGEPVTAGEAVDILVQREQERRQDTLQTLLQFSAFAVGLVGVSAVGFGWLMAGRVLRPISDITATAKRVAAGSHRGLHERIGLAGPDDEIKELADTVDSMLERLDESFASQRRFVDNASHELRTPLAINRTVLEVALADPQISADLRQIGRTLLATNARSEQLIEGLLLLARSEHELAERHPVELAEVVGHVLSMVALLADEAGVTLRRRLDSMATMGDPILLERLAQNLVGNAVTHNIPGGWVQVTTGPEGLSVSNTGPVVPGYEVAGLFEPFRRLNSDRARSDRGVGLGLSIVRSITHAHGGEIDAEPRADGGLVVRVRLPAPDAADG